MRGERGGDGETRERESVGVERLPSHASRALAPLCSSSLSILPAMQMPVGSGFTGEAWMMRQMDQTPLLVPSADPPLNASGYAGLGTGRERRRKKEGGRKAGAGVETGLDIPGSLNSNTSKHCHCSFGGRRFVGCVINTLLFHRS